MGMRLVLLENCKLLGRHFYSSRLGVRNSRSFSFSSRQRRLQSAEALSPGFMNFFTDCGEISWTAPTERKCPAKDRLWTDRTDRSSSRSRFCPMIGPPPFTDANPLKRFRTVWRSLADQMLDWSAICFLELLDKSDESNA